MREEPMPETESPVSKAATKSSLAARHTAAKTLSTRPVSNEKLAEPAKAPAVDPVVMKESALKVKTVTAAATATPAAINPATPDNSPAPAMAPLITKETASAIKPITAGIKPATPVKVNL
jgi:hypothetical protein